MRSTEISIAGLHVKQGVSERATDWIGAAQEIHIPTAFAPRGEPGVVAASEEVE